jgi:porin
MISRRLLPLLLASLFVVMPAGAEDAKPEGIGARYTTEIISDVSGGIAHGTGWLGRLDLHADSGDGFLGIPGASAHVDVFLLHGPRFSDRFVGDVQTVSNIDAPSALRPFEAWVQLPVATDVRAKVGLIDLNDEFDQQSLGDPFLNSSFGIGPDYSQSGRNGPSIYPVTSPGLVIAAEHGGTSLRIGIFDAEPGFPDHPGRFLPGPFGRDGALIAAEAGWALGKGARMQIGGWRYTDRFPRIDGSGRAASDGAYALVEGRLAGSEQGRAWRAWLRTGVAADAVNPIDLYIGGGTSYGDQATLFGFAIARAGLGSPGRRAGIGAHDAETTIEAMASGRLTGFLTIEPDVQYVVHPSWRADLRNVLVLALRFHVSVGAD